MALDEFLVQRITTELEGKKVEFNNKKMFGGMCFMVDDKLCLGTYKGGIMARIDPDEVDMLIKKPGAEQMIHGGRPMKGYLMLGPDAWDMDYDLSFWIQKCLEFNPRAKSSKRKK